MNALILADGDAPDREELDRAWPGWDKGLELVVAADGGARHARPLGVTIDLWVGDGDSLDPDGMATLMEGDVPMERVSPYKDESDTELAIRAAVSRVADRLVILGGLGGSRIDHSLANISLLAMPELVGREAMLLDGRSRIRLMTAPGADDRPASLSLLGPPGGRVSLLPFGDRVAGVTTQGLAYPLSDEPLPLGPSRGLSNIRLESHARVSVRAGRLLVIETPATLEE